MLTIWYMFVFFFNFHVFPCTLQNLSLPYIQTLTNVMWSRVKMANIALIHPDHTHVLTATRLARNARGLGQRNARLVILDFS